MTTSLAWHKSVLEQLADRRRSERLPHAMLLTVASDLEAIALAGALPYFIVCDSCAMCRQCRACRLLEQGAYSDYHLCQPEGTSKVIKIDQIRGLLNLGAKTANYPAGKVLILAPANALNRNAANALLKFLEEPPANTYLFLVASRTAQLPATVMSRCQKLTVARPDRQQALVFLQDRGVSEMRAKTLLRLASDEPLLALEIEESGTADALLRVVAEVEKLVLGQATPRGLGQSAQGLEANLLLTVLIAYAHQAAVGQATEHTLNTGLLLLHKALVELYATYLRSPNINIPLALEQLCVNIR
ncbi:MAG: hypothetical protein P8O79_07190 [Halieaceae bacterium]|nr:hypothetical protein [Halieaceae bacterium]